MKSKSIFALGWTVGFAATGAFTQTVEVTSTGVGIGTASPTALLDVQGTAIFRTSGGQELFRTVWDGGNTGGISSPSGRGLYLTGGSALANSQGLFLDGAGKVGIGTTAPDAPLTVYGSNVIGRFRSSAASALIYFTPVGGDEWRLGAGDINVSDFGIRNATDGETRLSITGTGNVGIGTTSPDARLTIDGGDNTAIRVKRSGVVSAYLGDPGSTDAGGLVLYDSGGNLRVLVDGASGGSTYFNTGGNFGFGTATLTHKVTVAGSVRATSFISDTTTYADFVFKPGYKLASLSEVEAAIQKNGHLPDIPSEAEAKAHGIDLAAMQVKLLQKVEELTLHLIAHEKELRSLRAETQTLPQLRSENESLRRRLSELETR
jgi:hypothetical protein